MSRMKTLSVPKKIPMPMANANVRRVRRGNQYNAWYGICFKNPKTINITTIKTVKLIKAPPIVINGSVSLGNAIFLIKFPLAMNTFKDFPKTSANNVQMTTPESI